ncbi:MAG TPA: hypothetical protein VJN44_20220 [Roseateles sp.]|nr:hypothetical protein [Roseateles sp.]
MHLRIAAIGLACCALAPMAVAQDPTSLDPVELRGMRSADPPRTDVRRSCPGVDADVRTALARSVYWSGEAATIHVRFQLNGHDVEHVQASGGPWDYRLPLRRAVQGMACSNDGLANQQYNFLVVIRSSDDDMDGPADRVAVRESPLLAQAVR